MKFIKIDADYFCGVDLHSRRMFTTVTNKSGDIQFKKNIKNNFELFNNYMKPYLPNLAVGVESTYNWYWLADGCHKANIPFYLGHALYMKAVAGAKNKNDKIDSKTIADLMRGNLFPPAYAYPQEMRSTRDLLRRRSYYVSLRSGANTHIQGTFSQQAILDIDRYDVKRKSTRHSLIDRSDDYGQQLMVQFDLDLMGVLDSIIASLEKKIRIQAQYHDGSTYETLLTIPGVGDILALTILYETHKLTRFPSVQKFSSYARVVKCERTSNNKKTGGGNQKIGNPYLKWAFHQIIIRAQLQEPLIKKYFERLLSKHGSRKARAIMAHKFAVAVYYMIKNGQPFDVVTFLKPKFK
jgi:transposase